MVRLLSGHESAIENWARARSTKHEAVQRLAATMKVDLINEGPVTILLDSRDKQS
jgi:D-Tyr-tRNAtyr deacylase